jgi:hypothetical protein
VDGGLVAVDGDINYSVWQSRPVLLYNLFSITRRQIMYFFRGRKLQYHIYCNMDLSKQFYPALTNEELNIIWRKNFESLFVFDKYFENIVPLLFGVAKNICGIHLRFVSLLGDFKEVANHALPDDEKKSLISKCIIHIKQIVSVDEYDKYLIVSDSISFLHDLKEELLINGQAEKVVILSGPIAHIDINHNEDVLKKTVLDFYLLSRCRVVYQILAGKMYNSQFCRYAAVLGNAEYRIEKI